MSAGGFDVIVVGGGPAGLMAAGVSAARGRRTLLLDKNEILGRKLRITGKGRCNVTNACTVAEAVASSPRGGKFLYGAFSAFTPEDTVSFFEGLGVRLKTERGKRVFPVSDSAHEIADALVNFAKNSGAVIKRGTVKKVLTKDGAVCGVRTEEGDISASRVLLACGGCSYPGTGSDGSGWKLLKELGHRAADPEPSLVPLVEKGNICKSLMGLSLKNCGVTVTEDGKKKPVYEDFGELLFTHFGLSGPVILSASAHLHRMRAGGYTVHIDLKPALSREQLDKRMLRDLEKNKNRDISNSLGELLPSKLIPAVIKLSGIPGDTKCNAVTKAQRASLLELLKDFSLVIEGFRPIAEAIVTRGGADLKEIDPKTMESKFVPGLFVAGELLDADAYTGGFNLQIAFSTGHAAGRAL